MEIFPGQNLIFGNNPVFEYNFKRYVDDFGLEFVFFLWGVEKEKLPKLPLLRLR